MIPAPAIRCEGVTKTYGIGESRVPALRGVDLEVLPGVRSVHRVVLPDRRDCRVRRRGPLAVDLPRVPRAGRQWTALAGG